MRPYIIGKRNFDKKHRNNSDSKKTSSKTVSIGSISIQVNKTQLIGSNRWDDNVEFDDFKEVPNLLKYRIEKIEMWKSTKFSSTTEINGIQITYREINTNEIFVTNLRKGQLGESYSKGSEVILLDRAEYIKDVTIRSGWVVDNLTFSTSKSQSKTFGGNGGDFRTFNELKDQVVIGTYGVYGTNLYSIGFYSISIEDYQKNLIFNSNLVYRLINHRIKGKKDELIKLIEVLKQKENEEKSRTYFPEITLARTISEMPRHVTLKIISFI
jgi:hypothetical protein